MQTPIYKAVIENEVHSKRFETFANQLISSQEGGAAIINTSDSWDLGKDGRGVLPTGQVFVCCSLTDAVEHKSSKDLRRLTTFEKKIKTVYFCSSKFLSEHRCNIIRTEIISLLDTDCLVIVYGSNHLAEIAGHHTGIIDQLYKAEIDDCISILMGREDRQEDAENALRLALLTTGADESIEIRGNLYKGGLLEVLKDNNSRNLSECCRDLSAILRLSRQIPQETILYHLKSLLGSGEIELVNDHYKITSIGKKFIDESQEKAASALVSGRNAFRAELEREIGYKLSDDHFERIWSITKQFLTQAFYTKGKTLVEFASTILNGAKASRHSLPTSAQFINELAIAVSETSSNNDQQQELKTSIVDIFLIKDGPVFNWFTTICFSFIALCSLGLESQSGKALATVISKIGLVFDTDVLLSLICQGEPEHDSVSAIQKRWNILGSPILIADPVLIETAHHSWIADFDFAQVENWIPGTHEDRQRLISNAFVRSFADLISDGKAKKNQWMKYIAQFKGHDEWDCSKTRAYIYHEYNLKELPQSTTEEQAIEKSAYVFLSEIAHREKDRKPLEKALDKAKRDAKLYASIIRQINSNRSKDPAYTCFLVSSSKRLSNLENHLNASGEGQIVITISMALYLLSLIPEVSIGMSSLSVFLFDERIPSINSGLERTLLRVVKNCSDLDMPWAKRTTLIQNIRENVVSSAAKAGKILRSDKDVEDFICNRENAKEAVRAITIALRDSVIDTKTEKDNLTLRIRVRELEEEIQKLRTSKRH